MTAHCRQVERRREATCGRSRVTAAVAALSPARKSPVRSAALQPLWSLEYGILFGKMVTQEKGLRSFDIRP